MTTQIRAAMAIAAHHLKVIVEPSGAAALAAVLAEPRPTGSCVAVVLSGGNVDAESARRRAARPTARNEAAPPPREMAHNAGRRR